MLEGERCAHTRCSDLHQSVAITLSEDQESWFTYESYMYVCVASVVEPKLFASALAPAPAFKKFRLRLRL
jgi:hypothetical protein